MKVTVFGTGYVGLVQGAVMAEIGHDVICVDVDETKVARLREGEIPIFEPGLDTLVIENQKKGRLSFTTDAKEGVSHGKCIFIAVGTPPDEDGSADLQYVLAVASTIAEHMEEHKLVVGKSTVPVGTAEKVKSKIDEVLKRLGKTLSYDVVSNPEFLKEGAAVEDCLRPDRIIIGTDSPSAVQVMRELYMPFSRNRDKMIVMDIRSAELTKYAANCMLATKISFMNEIANLAEHLDADVESVRKGIGSDPRIGYHFIYPGCGYGGSCFPKDVQALMRTADEIDFDAKMLKAVEARNQKQKQTLFEKLNREFEGNLEGKTIGLWGLAFKPKTDDMGEAPSRTLMEALWDAGAKVQAYDPEAMDECNRIYGQREDLRLCEKKYDVLEGADALVVVTEWKEFWVPDFDLIKEKLSSPIIVDGRNLFDPDLMSEKGISYSGVGRSSKPV